MSASEDLESLDNKTLRAKCMEYGLPNVPITDTSKKILIKKLRAVMEGGNAATNKGSKSRRETMHVTSTTTTTNTINTEEAKPSRASNRRTTIGAVRKEKEQTPKESALVDKRRTSRTTPIQETSIPISLPRKSAPVIIEETDFDDDFEFVEDDIKMPVITNIPIIRKSHSPSWSKSAIVTTSYKKDNINKEQKILEEEETEEEGYIEKRKEYNLSRQFIPSRERDIPNISNVTIPRYNLSTNVRTSTEKDIYPAGYKPLYPTLNTVDNLPNSKSSYESTSSIIKRTYTPTGGLHSTGSLRKSADIDVANRKKTNYVAAENSDSNDNEEEDEIVQKAPYLSDFARRLSTLKAEKLDIGIKKDFYSPGDAYTRTIGRRTYAQIDSERSGVADSFRQLWVVLDRKYRIKRFIFVVAILSAIILCIYYFYLKNY